MSWHSPACHFDLADKIACQPFRHQSSVKRSCRRPAHPLSATTDAAELLRAADDLIQLVAKGEAPLKQAEEAPVQQGYNSTQQSMLQCDISGCTIVPLSPTEPPVGGPAGSFMGSSGLESPGNRGGSPVDWHSSEGAGWRLGYDRCPAPGSQYSALLGGDSWSVALTQPELEDFVQLLQNLRQSVATLSGCGEWSSESGDATLEIGTDRVWMQGRAPRQRLSQLQDFWKGDATDKESPQGAFALRFILTSPGQREVEGGWTPEAVMAILKLLDTDDFLASRPSGQLKLRHTPRSTEQAMA